MSLCISLKAASERMTYNITETCHYLSVLKCKKDTRKVQSVSLLQAYI